MLEPFNAVVEELESSSAEDRSGEQAQELFGFVRFQSILRITRHEEFNGGEFCFGDELGAGCVHVSSSGVVAYQYRPRTGCLRKGEHRSACITGLIGDDQPAAQYDEPQADGD